MTILTQAADEISPESLLAFLGEQIPESINLEYKESASKGLLESIAAMANTNGGVILLGVSDKNGLPSQQPVGVPLTEMSVLVNRCWTSLDPPMTPEVVPVCVDQAHQQYVLVVRVDAAQVDRPVFLEGRTKIRLHGRNATAGRRQVAALFAEEKWGTPGRISMLGGYGARSAHPLLGPQDEGLGIRVALSAATSSSGARLLGTAIHDQLGELLERSPLERWLREATYIHPRPDPNIGWNREGMNTSTVVTFLRTGKRTLDKDYELQGQCVLEAPFGPRQGPYVTLLLGVAFEPVEGIYKALTVKDLYELIHVFYATALDCIASELFPRITATPLWEPLGPQLHLDPGNQKSLADYVDFAPLKRAPGSSDLNSAWLEPDIGIDLRDYSERDTLIKEWLVKVLLDRGYTDVEKQVHLFAPPA